MKLKLYFVFLSLSCLTFKSLAEENICAADVSKYTPEGLKSRTPIFDSKNKKIDKIYPSKLQQHGFEDKIKLKDGTEITYTTGGCAHYGYSFHFHGKEIRKTKSSEKLKRAELLLKSLELTNSEEKDLLLGVLTKAQEKVETKNTPKNPSDGLLINLPCGDAICYLEDRDNQEVKISYDFPL